MTFCTDQNQAIIGVAVGPNRIRAGIFRDGLKFKRPLKLSTKFERGVDEVLRRIVRAVDDVADEADLTRDDIRGVGVGIPGMVDRATGNVLCAASLGWEKVALCQRLESDLGVPVAVESVGNLATLAVYTTELKVKPAKLLGLFVGAGLTGGVIHNGEIQREADQSFGEIGRMVVAVESPNSFAAGRDCLDDWVGRNAVAQRIRQAAAAGTATVLTDLLDGDLSHISTKILRKALRMGDSLVESCLQDSARHLGLAVGRLFDLVQPQGIVLGGDMMEAFSEPMFPVMMDAARNHTRAGSLDSCSVYVSRMGDMAGVIGAAILAGQMTGVPQQ